MIKAYVCNVMLDLIRVRFPLPEIRDKMAVARAH